MAAEANRSREERQQAADEEAARLAEDKRRLVDRNSRVRQYTLLLLIYEAGTMSTLFFATISLPCSPAFALGGGGGGG